MEDNQAYERIADRLLEVSAWQALEIRELKAKIVNLQASLLQTQALAYAYNLEALLLRDIADVLKQTLRDLQDQISALVAAHQN